MLKLSRTHSILATAAALASLLPAAAHAQKPALTQNIDEKGRTPYYDTESTPNCIDDFIHICYLYFKTVPAGYRLVVTHVSLQYLAVSSSGINTAAFASGGSSQGGNQYQVFLPAPTANGQNVYTYSSPITAYAEPGLQPYIYLYNAQFTSYGPIGTISGYLVALNE
jgi:hypothetical protein